MTRLVFCLLLAASADRAVQAGMPAGTARSKRPTRSLTLAEAVRPGLETAFHATFVTPESGPPYLTIGRRRETEAPLLQTAASQALRDIEVAYWDLHGAQVVLGIRDQGLRSALQVWKQTRGRYEAGRATRADVAQARAQCDLFRAERREALKRAKDAEGRLRELTGLGREDGCRLVPCDVPSTQSVSPDWATAFEAAIKNRPELVMPRRALEAEQLQYRAAKHLQDLLNCWPLLATTWAVVEPFLPKPQELRWLGRTGMPPPRTRYSGPVHRWAGVELVRATQALTDQELWVARYLELSYRRLYECHEIIATQRKQCEAYARLFRKYEREVAEGRSNLGDLLEVQRLWVEALVNESHGVVGYNEAQATFAFGKAAALQRHGVHLTFDSGSNPPGFCLTIPRPTAGRTKAAVGGLGGPGHDE
jgi:Outer membrane efflux protein